MKRLKITKFISILLVIMSVSHGGVIAAQNSDSVDLDQLKVAFIFNFSKYFTWPDNGKWRDIETLNVCISNPKVANGHFGSLAGQTSQARTINVIDLSKLYLNIGENCHIWFIDQASFQKNQASLEALGASDVLTVSDYSGFLSAGGIMEFVEVDNRMKFKINTQAAQDKRLTISSSLMRLALKNN